MIAQSVEHLQEHVTLTPRAHIKSRSNSAVIPVTVRWEGEVGSSLEFCDSWSSLLSEISGEYVTLSQTKRGICLRNT